MRRASRACVLPTVCTRVYLYTSSVTSERMVGDAPAHEILPHWIHGAVSGVERPSL